MEEKLITWLKRPSIMRAVYISCCMIISFALGVTGEFLLTHRNDNPVIEIPEKPIPLAYQYKSHVPENPMDTVAAAEASEPSKEPITTTEGSRRFVASKTGKNYYPDGCAGISRIKEENRVYFATEQEAKTKGYTRSESCK